MANKLYDEGAIKNIAIAIRNKNGSGTKYKVSEMGDAVRALADEAHAVTIAVSTSETSLYGVEVDLQLGGVIVKTGVMSSAGACSFGGIVDAGTYTVVCGEASGEVEIDNDMILAASTETVTLSLFTQPSKEQIITMTLGNTYEAGTNNQYRILSVNGTVALVMAMYDYKTSCVFSSSNNTYAGGTLDTMLNTTFFESLSTEAQNAIQSVDITQYQYTFDSSSYNASTHASLFTYSSKSTKATISQRKVFALDYEDIVNYFGGDSFSTSNIWYMFWNTPSQPSTVTCPWLRSAGADGSFYALVVYGYDGSVRSSGFNSSFAARPAFYIDLSKISWS